MSLSYSEIKFFPMPFEAFQNYLLRCNQQFCRGMWSFPLVDPHDFSFQENHSQVVRAGLFLILTHQFLTRMNVKILGVILVQHYSDFIRFGIFYFFYNFATFLTSVYLLVSFTICRLALIHFHITNHYLVNLWNLLEILAFLEEKTSRYFSPETEYVFRFHQF